MRTEFSDGHISIRRLRAADAASLHEAANESLKEIIPGMRWFEQSFSPEDSVAWIQRTESMWEKKEAYNFAVVEETTGRLAGSNWLSFVNHKHRHANLGYWVRTSCTGRGIATAAARLIVRFGFDELRLNRIEIMAAIGNRASERVAEKLGAQREGILYERLQLEGEARDVTMFGLLARNFRKRP